MLDEDAAAGHSERKAGEGAAGFDPAGGEALERVNRGRYASVLRSGGQSGAVEIKEVGAHASEKGPKNEKEYGATQPHPGTRPGQRPPQKSSFAPRPNGTV